MGLVKLFDRIHLTLALDGTVPAGFAGMPTFKNLPCPTGFMKVSPDSTARPAGIAVSGADC